MNQDAPGATPGPRRWLAAALAFLLALVAFAGAMDGRFVFDDETYVVRNSAVTGDDSPWTSSTPPNRPELGLYRPLTVLTYRMQFEAAGLDPVAFRRVNVLLHALAAALFALVAARLGASRGASLAAGALFATHPVHVEAVAWVVGRAEVLATVFAFAALLVRPRQGDRFGGSRFALSLAFAVAAMLSKETALALPLVFVFLDRWEGFDLRSRGARFAAYVAVTVGIAWLRIRILGRFSPDVDAISLIGGLDFAQRGELALRILGLSAKTLCLPFDLSIYYEPRAVAGTLRLVAGIAVAIVAGLVAIRSRVPAARTGAILFVAGILPFLHLVPIGWVFGDRFLYLASAGAILAAVCLADRAAVASRAKHVAAILVTAGFLLLTLDRVPVFANDLALWRDAAAKDPSSAYAQFQVAGLLKDAGRLEFVSDAERGAVWHWTESLRVEPDHGFANRAHLELGAYAAAKLGDGAAAANHFRAAIAMDPGTTQSVTIDALIELAGLYRPGASADRRAIGVDESVASIRRAGLAKPDPRQRAILLNLLNGIAAAGEFKDAAAIEAIRKTLGP